MSHVPKPNTLTCLRLLRIFNLFDTMSTSARVNSKASRPLQNLAHKPIPALEFWFVETPRFFQGPPRLYVSVQRRSRVQGDLLGHLIHQLGIDYCCRQAFITQRAFSAWRSRSRRSRCQGRGRQQGKPPTGASQSQWKERRQARGSTSAWLSAARWPRPCE